MTHARPQIAVNTEAEAAPARAEVKAVASHLRPVTDAVAKDHFVARDGLVYAGSHLIIDMWGAKRLDDIDRVERALTAAAEVAGATVLHTHLHRFTPNGGVSGVVVLAESHISIHTWPERGYAALDIFMCGAAEPMKAIPVLRHAFEPERVSVSEHKRGVL